MREDKLQEIIELLPYSIRYSGEIEELLDYAKEQAERVWELERVEYALQETYRQEREYNKRLEQQNQRYREALKGVLKILDSEDWHKYDTAALQDNIDEYLTLENGDLLEGEE